jgi:hypothetical protein
MSINPPKSALIGALNANDYLSDPYSIHQRWSWPQQLFSMARFSRGKCPPIRNGIRVLPESPRLTHLSHTHHDFDVPATKRARWCSCNVRCVHPSFELRQGHLRHSTSSSCPRFCKHPPDYDSGKFPTTLRRYTPDSCPSRIRWPTIKITWNLDGIAGMYVKCSTVDWREDDWMTLTSLSSMRLEI